MSGYGRKYQRTRTEKVRVVVELEPQQVSDIDEWGVPAGMPSRAAAIRHLVKSGLVRVNEEGAGTNASV